MAVMSSAHVVTKVVVSCRTMLGVDIDVDEIHNNISQHYWWYQFSCSGMVLGCTVPSHSNVCKGMYMASKKQNRCTIRRLLG